MSSLSIKKNFSQKQQRHECVGEVQNVEADEGSCSSKNGFPLTSSSAFEEAQGSLAPSDSVDALTTKASTGAPCSISSHSGVQGARGACGGVEVNNRSHEGRDEAGGGGMPLTALGSNCHASPATGDTAAAKTIAKPAAVGGRHFSAAPLAIPTRPPLKRLQAQPFSHILVCDFEATCESGSVEYPHEIIEFPVVVVDTATLSVVAEFHSYVRPVRNPKLSSFCTELTGITQETTDAADPLPVVVRRFGAWLRETVYPLCAAWRARYGNNALSPNLAAEKKRFVYDECTPHREEEMVCFATDGPWDMRRFMHQCSVLRDGVDFPPICYRFINVRNCFSVFFKTRQARLTHMLKRLGMSFQGNPHSGIDDARNIARVFAELLARGYRVHNISTIKYVHAGDVLEKSPSLEKLLREEDEQGPERRGHSKLSKANPKLKKRNRKKK